MNCLLVTSEEGELGRAKLNDGRTVVFYLLVPLYPEERELERRQGIAELLRRLKAHGVGKVVDMARPSLVTRDES